MLGKAVGVVAVLLAGLLAGCTSSHDAPTSTSSTCPAPPSDVVYDAGSGGCGSAGPPSQVNVRGVVVDPSIHPIVNATVTLVDEHVSTKTASNGMFDFGPRAPKIFTLKVTAKGFLGQTLIGDGSTVFKFVLEVDRLQVTPYNTTVTFHGHYDCGIEVLIIPGPCGILFDFAGQPDPLPFTNTTTFYFQTDPTWKTIVMDFAFDHPSPATFDGYHFSLSAPNDANQLGTYQLYGRFSGQESFTARITPGATLPESSNGPLPQNATTFRLEGYPMGYGYHPGGIGVLGVGAGLNMDFQVVVTTFYIQDAPDGFTKLS